MILYRNDYLGSVIEVAKIEIDERTTFESELQGGDYISCSFTLSRAIDIKKGDFTIWRGKKFFAEDVIPLHKKKTNEFDYNFKLYDFYFYLQDAMLQFEGEMDFNFFGNLQEQAEILVESFNKIGRKSIVLGDIPDTEPKNLKFYNTDCESALHRLCKEWGVEFQFIGDNLSFVKKIGNPTGLVFKFKNGVRGIERKKVNDTRLITRLYAFGSSRNIPKDYGSKKLRIDPIERGVFEFGTIEAVKEFKDIYPHRTGVISAVNSDICKFQDDSLDFDVNEQAIEGINVKLTFTSGDLSGHEFEVHSYDHSTKEFDIISKTDETNAEYPSETFKPKVGDKYVLHDIIMPQSYIDAAEEELRQKATEYLAKYSVPQMSYEITPDYVMLRRNGIELSVGDITTTEDRSFNISRSTRIIGLSQVLVSPFKYTLKVGDKATVSYLKRTLAKQIELDIALQVERDDRKADYRRIRRGLIQVEELKSSIFDQDGYFDATKIKPLSIETKMLSVGSRALRMNFEGLHITPNYNSCADSLYVSTSKLIHFTVDEEIREWRLSQNQFHLSDPNKYYYLYARCRRKGKGGRYLVTTNKLKLEYDSHYYFFLIGVIHSEIDGIRGASLQYGQTYINGKFITTGVIMSANKRMVIDLDNGSIQGDIKFLRSGGLTDLGEWAGNTDSNVKNATDKADNAQSDAAEAKKTANQAKAKAEQALVDAAQNVIDYNNKIAGIQSQLDGEVSGWFYPYTPTLDNYPANDWGTDEEKERHIGDTFTNTEQSPAENAGKSWRFVKDGDSYEWTLIADSDAVKALKKASKAQATADGKNTTYMVQPTSYKLGDFWILNADKTIAGVEYKQSELLQATQDSEVFNENHWCKALRYIDEHKAQGLIDNIEIGGRNYVLDSKVNPKYNCKKHRYRYQLSKELRHLKIGDKLAFSFLGKFESKHNIRVYVYNPVDGIFATKEKWMKSSNGEKIYKGVLEVNKNIIINEKFSITVADDHGKQVDISFMNLNKGNKATDWSPAPEDLQKEIDDKVNTAKTESKAAWEAYAQAKANAAKIEAIANADGKITAEEQARIDADNAKLQASKDYADAKDAEKEAILKAYADGIVTASEQASIDAAKAYADLKQQEAQAYADGKITEEEQRAIADAEAKYEAAKQHAKDLVNDIEIGVRNYALRSKGAPNYNTSSSRYRYQLSSRLGFLQKGDKLAFSFLGKFNSKHNIRVYVYNPVDGIFATKEKWMKSSNGEKIYKGVLEVNKNIIINEKFSITVADDHGKQVDISFMNLNKGNKATDWSPAPEDLLSEVDKAKQRIEKINDSLSEDIINANMSIIDLHGYVDGAFADGVISKAEKVALKKLILSVNEAFEKSKASFDALKENKYLTNKDYLQHAYNGVCNCKDELLISIGSVIEDNLASPDEIEAVENLYQDYIEALKEFQIAVEAANKEIQNKIKDLSFDKIDKIGEIGENLLKNPSFQNKDNWSFSNTSATVHTGDEYVGNYNTAINIYSACKASQSINLEDGLYELSCYVRCWSNSSNALIALKIGDDQKEIEITGTKYRKIAFKSKVSNASSVGIGVIQGDVLVTNAYIGEQHSIMAKIDPAKEVADYLSKALASDTLVKGGLVLTSVLAARNEKGKVKSYVSGNPNTNPIAFAAGVDGFGTKAETQNVAINHDGTAKVGIFSIDNEGDVRIMDENNFERIVFRKGKIDNLDDIINASSFEDSSNNQSGHTIYTNDTSLDIDLGVSVEASKDGGYIDIDWDTLLHVEEGDDTDEEEWGLMQNSTDESKDSEAYTVNILLTKDNSSASSVHQFYMDGESSDRLEHCKQRIYVGKGTYRLRAIVDVVDDYYWGSAKFSNIKMKWKLDAAKFRKLVFGKDGFLGAFPNMVFHLSKEGFVVKGKTDLPGTLASASCDKRGTQINHWGVYEQGDGIRISTGRYRIYHNIGHNEYTVMCTPHYGYNAMSVQIGIKTGSYFEVYFFDKNGNLINTPFDYAIHGENK